MMALISSVPKEGNLIIKRLGDKSIRGGKVIYRGTIDEKDVVYAVSGVGKTNAAHAATLLIERFSPKGIMLFGVGGAYPHAGLKVGDIAVAEREIYGDEGVLDRDGFHGSDFIGIPLLKRGIRRYFNRFPLDRKLVATAIEASERITHHSLLITIKCGNFVTVSACTGTRKRARELEIKHKAICESMEGAAVAHVCAMYGIPLMEIRGISNIVEDRDKGKWDIKLAAQNCQKVVIEMLKNL